MPDATSEMPTYRITNYELRITNDDLRFTNDDLRITIYE